MEKFNKNLIIGFLLVAALVFGFIWYNQNRELAQLKTSDNSPQEQTAQDTTKDEDEEMNAASSQPSTTQDFILNQECLKLKSEIEYRIENREIGNCRVRRCSLEQLFYSPKVNSCLYIRYEDLGYSTAPFQRHLIRSLYDVLNDGYNSRPLEQCIVIEPGENCNDFDAKLVEYKK